MHEVAIGKMVFGFVLFMFFLNMSLGPHKHTGLFTYTPITPTMTDKIIMRISVGVAAICLVCIFDGCSDHSRIVRESLGLSPIFPDLF